MKPTFRFVALVFGLALLLAPARPGSTAEASTYERLQQEGWTLVSPNVLQRPMGSGKVETIGFGVEGLEFKIAGMKQDLASFKESLRRNPDPQLRKIVQAYRAEIKRLTQNLALMAEADPITAKADIDCATNYGAHADAFPLSTTQGVGASADAYFNNNCTQGEVWVTTTSAAASPTGAFTRSTKTDPVTGGDAPYTGNNVSAASSTSVAGVAQCFSYAYGSVMSFDLGLVYEQRAENRLCPNPSPPMSVAIYGPTGPVSVPYGSCTWLTYQAAVSGGTSPYTYRWSTSTPVGSTISATDSNGKSYSITLCGQIRNYSEDLTLTLQVTDSSGRIQSTSMQIRITVS